MPESYVPFEGSIVDELRQLLADGVTDPFVLQSLCRLIVNTEIHYGHKEIRQALADIRGEIGLFTFLRDAFDSVNRQEAVACAKARATEDLCRGSLNHLAAAG